MLKNATNVVKKGLEVPFIKKAVVNQKKIDYQSDNRLQIIGSGLGSTVKHHA
jgi:hypothetical protein